MSCEPPLTRGAVGEADWGETTAQPQKRHRPQADFKVPPVGLEPFDSPDSISSDPAMSLDDLERLSPACFYMISWMVLSVAFKTALH